jgi:hypothetical protein
MALDDCVEQIVCHAVDTVAQFIVANLLADGLHAFDASDASAVGRDGRE